MHESDRILEIGGRELRELIDSAAELIIEHLESLPKQPAADLDGAAQLARSFKEPLPETGCDVGNLMKQVVRKAAPKSLNTASPGYLAYIPGGGLPQSAVADLISGTLNRYVGAWIGAPALVQLESNVIQWMCSLAGYPSGAGGILTSGGSLANFSAIVAARRSLLPEDFLKGTVYASDQVHHSVSKAAGLAGFPPQNVRRVMTDDRYRVRLDSLGESILADLGQGLSPFLIVGSAGTTNTGAVDDLNGLADIAAEFGMWLHIDAAYGGFFLLTDRGQAIMGGVERSDSVTLDPHKGLFLPYGTGMLIVRDQESLRKAHHAEADYMPAMRQEPDFVDFCELSPELSRAFRGLRVWLPLKMYGAAVFRRYLDEKIDLAQWAAERLKEYPSLEILAEPQVSAFAFRLKPPRLADEASLERLNRQFLKRINARHRVYLTSTILHGRFALRICVLSFRTHEEHLQAALEDIRLAADECMGAAVG